MPEATRRDGPAQLGKPPVAAFAGTLGDLEGQFHAVDGDAAMWSHDGAVKPRFDREGAPVEVDILLRGRDADWQVIDMDLNGTISQLATGRSADGSTPQGGFGGLTAAVTARADKDVRAF